MSEAREPKRIRMRRTKGWRKPVNAVYVGRPSKWGNPFTLEMLRECFLPQEFCQAFVVMAFEGWLDEPCGGGEFRAKRREILNSIDELRGKDLACWCPLDQPCHADVLLELANKTKRGETQ